MRTPGKQMQKLDWFSSPDFQTAFVTVTGKGRDMGMGPLVRSGPGGSFWCGCFEGHCQLGMQLLPTSAALLCWPNMQPWWLCCVEGRLLLKYRSLVSSCDFSSPFLSPLYTPGIALIAI